MAERIKITICFAPASQPILYALEVDEGTTIGQAIEISGILQDAPEHHCVRRHRELRVADAQGQALPRSERREFVAKLLEQRRQRGRTHVGSERAGVELGDLQQRP